MSPLAIALRSGPVLLMDGAMGTEIQRAGIRTDECCESWNLAKPDKVQAIHAAYVEVGAEVLLTNTFQANPQSLGRHHLHEKLTSIIEQGIALARGTLAPGASVLAAFGPMGTIAQAEWNALLEASHAADGILLETISDLREAEELARAHQSTFGAGKPILLSFTFDGATMRTYRDLTPEACAARAEKLGAGAVGVNCGKEIDLSACADILRRYRSATALPLFARPNAGTPDSDVYPRSPEQMAEELLGLLEAGAIMVGGCCGTTPQHIQAFRGVVDAWNRDIKTGSRPR